MIKTSLNKEQITEKIDESLLTKQINPKIINKNGLFINSEDKENHSEESDGGLGDTQGQCALDCEYEIKNMYFSRNQADFSYLAIKSDFKV